MFLKKILKMLILTNIVYSPIGYELQSIHLSDNPSLKGDCISLLTIRCWLKGDAGKVKLSQFQNFVQITVGPKYRDDPRDTKLKETLM